MTWLFPLENCNGIPINNHPGAFGFKRRYDFHTGVDLYCEDKEPVFAVEDGEVVKKEPFTGTALGLSWWEDTDAVMVKGESGFVNYGEINTNLSIGRFVKKGEQIGVVKRVLFEHKKRWDITGHSTSMLHIELYDALVDWAVWVHECPDHLLNPTLFLLKSNEKKFPTLEGILSS